MYDINIKKLLSTQKGGKIPHCFSVPPTDLPLVTCAIMLIKRVSCSIAQRIGITGTERHEAAHVLLE